MKIRTLERYAAVVFLVQAILVFLALIGIGVRVAVYGSLDGGAGFYLFVVSVSVPVLVCLDAGTILNLPFAQRNEGRYVVLEWIHTTLSGRAVLLISLSVTVLWLVASITSIVLSFISESSFEYASLWSELIAISISITFLFFLLQLVILSYLAKANRERRPTYRNSTNHSAEKHRVSQLWKSTAGSISRLIVGGKKRIGALVHLSAPSDKDSDSERHSVENGATERSNTRIIEEEDEEMALERDDAVSEWERVPMDTSSPAANRVSWGGESIATAPPLYSRPPSYVSEAPTPRGPQTPIPLSYQASSPSFGGMLSPAPPSYRSHEVALPDDLGSSPVPRSQRVRTRRYGPYRARIIGNQRTRGR